MKNSRFFTFLTALFLSFFVISCSNLFESRQGCITVNLPSDGARSSFSAGDITHYKMQVFSSTNYDIPVQTKTVPAGSSSLTSNPLEDGLYHILLQTLRNGEVIGSGATFDDQPAELKGGKSTPVDITIRMYEISSLSAGVIIKDNKNQTLYPVISEASGDYYIVEPVKTYSFESTVSGGLSPYKYSWEDASTYPPNSYSTAAKFSHIFDSDTELIYLTVSDSNNNLKGCSIGFYRPVLSFKSPSVLDGTTYINFSTGCPLPVGNIRIFIDGEITDNKQALLTTPDYTYTLPSLNAGTHTVAIQYEYSDINGNILTLPSVKTEITVSAPASTDPDPAESSNTFYVNGKVTAEGDGSSTNPFKTLGTALTAISKNAEVTEAEIILTSATDNLFSPDSSGTSVYTIEKNITIKSQKQNTVVSLNNPNTQLWITNTGTLTFDATSYSMSIRSEGNEENHVSLNQDFIIANGGNLSLINTDFNSIYSSKSLIKVQSNGTLNLSESELKYNTCENVLTISGSNANLKTGVIGHNTCTSSTEPNGTIVVQNLSTLNIGQTEASTSSFFKIDSNTSQNAGAIYTKSGDMTQPVVNILSSVLIQNNIGTADSDATGGIYIYNGSTVKINGSNIQIDNNFLKEANGTSSNFAKPSSGTGILYINDVLQTTIPTKVNL